MRSLDLDYFAKGSSAECSKCVVDENDGLGLICEGQFRGVFEMCHQRDRWNWTVSRREFLWSGHNASSLRSLDFDRFEKGSSAECPKCIIDEITVLGPFSEGQFHGVVEMRHLR